MRKVLRWIGIVLAALVAMLVLLVAGLYVSAGTRMERTYNVEPEVLAIPSDPEALRQGGYLVNILCTGCHGEDLGGEIVFEDPGIGRIVGDNLTAGQGGVGGFYSDAGWVLAIRHGIGPDGKPLFVMPSADFYYLNDHDLGAVIAYLRSVPPVDNDLGEIRVTPMARLLVAAGVYKNPFSAEQIDHSAPRPQAVGPGITAEYGEYLVLSFGCQGCHGPDLGGGQHPAPDGPSVPNITTAGNLAGWTEGDFLTAARTRKSPLMPWEGMSQMTEADLKAIWLYLQSVPPR